MIKQHIHYESERAEMPSDAAHPHPEGARTQQHTDQVQTPSTARQRKQSSRSSRSGICKIDNNNCNIKTQTKARSTAAAAATSSTTTPYNGSSPIVKQTSRRTDGQWPLAQDTSKPHSPSSWPTPCIQETILYRSSLRVRNSELTLSVRSPKNFL